MQNKFTPKVSQPVRIIASILLLALGGWFILPKIYTPRVLQIATIMTLVTLLILGVRFVLQKIGILRALQTLGIVALIALFISGGWWVQVLLARRQPPTTIADIAYDNIRRARTVDYRVFIEESGQLVPYLVLTADYGGNVLLLREYVMDERRPVNPTPNQRPRMWAWSDFGAYYPDSNIDNFLNTEFKDTLGESVIAAIVPSNIVVTHRESLGRTGRDSQIITRYVFLLSNKELGVPDSSIAVSEGQTLRYFRGYHAGRVATLSCDMAIHYWTRTPSTWGTYSVYLIGANIIDVDTADMYQGVRPAFAVARTTPITTLTNITSGDTVFVLDCRLDL